LNTALGFDFKSNDNDDLDVRIRFTFFDENFNIIESKDSVINQIKIPDEFSLMKNYPNPFNPKTNIQFTVPEQSFVKLFIYDINGRIVHKIIDSDLKSGYYSVVWDGTNELGLKVGSGIYFYRLEAKNFTSSQKMIFIK
jgi:flagellar hook assembly protein FlgD